MTHSGVMIHRTLPKERVDSRPRTRGFTSRRGRGSLDLDRRYLLLNDASAASGQRHRHGRTEIHEAPVSGLKDHRRAVPSSEPETRNESSPEIATELTRPA